MLIGPILGALLLWAAAPAPSPGAPGFRRVQGHGSTDVPLDLEGGSYGAVRSALVARAWPAEATVQVDQLVNHFDFDYPDPEGRRPFSLTTEVANCPWNAGHLLALVGIQGRHGAPVTTGPRRLVFLIDVGPDMRRPGRLPMLRTALRALAATLGSEDRMAIVVYGAGEAGVALEPSSGLAQEAILRAIGDVEITPPAEKADGPALAYELARNLTGEAHVVVVTAGDFSGGTTPAALAAAAEAGRAEGITLDAIGVGMAGARFEPAHDLAEKGGGMSATVDSFAEARQAFMTLAGGAPQAIARHVSIAVKWNPRVVGSYRLLGSMDPPGVATFLPEMPPGHSITALYELAPPDQDQAALVDEQGMPRHGKGRELFTLAVRYKEVDANRNRLFTVPVSAGFGPDRPSPDLRFAAAVAEFGLMLRRDPAAINASWDQVQRLAASAREPDPGGQRAEFLRLIKQARQLNETGGAKDPSPSPRPALN